MKSVRSFETHSAEETEAVGRMLAGLLPATGTVLLIGELGAGKTALAKGILEGRGLARSEDVVSPTFTLIHEYGERLTGSHGAPAHAYHIDLYRLDTAGEARRLGLEDIFDEPALVLVEWGDRFPELLPAHRIEIHLQHAGEASRHIEVFSVA